MGQSETNVDIKCTCIRRNHLAHLYNTQTCLFYAILSCLWCSILSTDLFVVRSKVAGCQSRQEIVMSITITIDVIATSTWISRVSFCNFSLRSSSPFQLFTEHRCLKIRAIRGYICNCYNLKIVRKHVLFNNMLSLCVWLFFVGN